MLLVEFNLMESKNLKNVSNLQSIIEKSSSPVYILVAGSVGSGKSFIVGKHLPTINVIDPDAFTTELGDGQYDSKYVAKSMAMVRLAVSEKLKNMETFIQQGTSANLQSSINKLKLAKKNGFKTILLYVDTPIEQAVEQIKKRVSSGGHGETIDVKKVENTSNGARLTFRTLTGEDFDKLSNDDVERVNQALEKTEKDLEKVRTQLDYFIRIDNKIN